MEFQLLNQYHSIGDHNIFTVKATTALKAQIFLGESNLDNCKTNRGISCILKNLLSSCFPFFPLKVLQFWVQLCKELKHNLCINEWYNAKGAYSKTTDTTTGERI